MRTRLLHTEGFRIAAIFVVLFAILAGAMALSVLVVMDQELRSQIVEFAGADIAAVQAGYDALGVNEAKEIIDQRMKARGASDFFLLQQKGQRLAGNLTPMPEKTGILTLSVPGARPGRAVLGAAAYLAPGLYIFSGSDLSHARQAGRRILRTLFWLFAAAVAAAVIGGVLVSRFFLKRTDAIARACRAIMDGNLTTRVPVRGTGDELDRLSRTINEMLDRIAGLMENVRQVTNDIAHDLRTPVSHLRHRLEHARLKAGAAADYDKALEAAIAASDEILTLFAALLRIAQIEGGARRAGFASVDLAEVLGQMREIFGPVADDARHSLTVVAPEPVTIRGDRELIVQLLSNLIENAIVHTPDGTRIELRLTSGSDGAVLCVEDNGPGVPEEEHAKLLQPLYRREASRSRPGHGVGLALVNAIAELHGARLRIGKSAAGGFSISIAFPASG